MDLALLTRDDMALRPSGTERAPWLREALAVEGDPTPLPPLTGTRSVDVAIVGGGYTGLWTAWHLLERDPGLGVTVVEQDICGAGPSGRNGGFANGWWDELGTLVALAGGDEAAALASAREAAASVAAIADWCAAHGVDAHVRRAGMLTVSTTPLHDDRWADEVALAARLGEPDAYRALGPEEVAAICRSPRFRGGALMRDGATVHPGHLVRGLRRACLERGVTIHEGTRVERIVPRGSGVVLRTPAGELRARRAVLAVNAWGAGWPRVRRHVLAWGSYMVRTEPIPDLVERELGWTSGTSIVDARFSVHYLHVTRDGRIAIGAGGGRPALGGRIGPSLTDDVGSARRAAWAFRWLFPALREVRLTDAWGGPIDVGPDHLPRVLRLAGGRLVAVAGYSGNGVAPAHLVGRVVAALAVDADDAIARLPIVGSPRAFPPEPFRWVGARVLRAAMIRREDGEELGRPAPWPLRALTRLPRALGYRLGPGD